MGEVVITKQSEVDVGAATMTLLCPGYKVCPDKFYEVVQENNEETLSVGGFHDIHIDAGGCNVCCVNHKRGEVFDRPDVTNFFSGGLC